MPGLFTPPPHLNERTNLHTNLLQPAPRYALATETSGRQVTGDMDAHETRPRHGHNSTFDFSAPASQNFSAAPSWQTNFDRTPSFHPKSPPPLTNDRYQLAGGMDTPIAGGSRRLYGDYDDYFHLEQQRGMWASPTPYTAQRAHDLQPSPSTPKPWVLNQIFNLVGGVAGKLVQFCSVPFRGFSAGGGQAYTFEADGAVAAQLFQEPRAGPVRHLTPGHFPEDDNFGVRSVDSIDNERPRMPKRLRTGEHGESWVVINDDGSTDSRPSSPRLTERRVPVQNRSPSQIPRPVPRAANLSTPNPKRPSLIPVSRRSTLDRKSLQGAAVKPDPQPLAHSHSRSYSRQSYGSPVLFETRSPSSKAKHSLPPESHRLINKVRREEFEDDMRLRRMSSQMSAMLREAREALGNKVDIDD
ncbi:hypothetical protein DM02DRAFT_505168, partial [Periconia macrospinosa]